jgi:hypothetical protein
VGQGRDEDILERSAADGLISLEVADSYLTDKGAPEG